jgi:endonuclease/exonuclease/phosphatase family metal-dependent hydrolase
MRVVTFNIQHGRRASRPGSSTRLLSRYCKGLGADVLALQEVDVRAWRTLLAHQARAVAHASRMEHVFGAARRLGFLGRYGNALLVRGRLRDVEVMSFPRRPGTEPRSGILATAVMGDLRLSVAGTHLATRSEESIPQLEALVQALADRPPPHLLMGDFNLIPEEVAPRVAAVGLEMVPAQPTYPAAAPRAHIDHVVLGGLSAREVEVLPAAPVSDHRALRVEVDASSSP